MFAIDVSQVILGKVRGTMRQGCDVWSCGRATKKREKDGEKERKGDERYQLKPERAKRERER